MSKHLHNLTLASAKHLHNQGHITKAQHDMIVGKASSAMAAAPHQEQAAMAPPASIPAPVFGSIGRPGNG